MCIINITSVRGSFPGREHDGMTLLEVVLVLALLVVMGALALPSLKRSFENQRLLKAGEIVRIAWNKARIQALKTGQTHMFCYDAEHGTYATQPYYSDPDILAAGAGRGDGIATGVAVPPATGVQESGMIATQKKPLPEGVVFISSSVQADLRAVQLKQNVRGGFRNRAETPSGSADSRQESPPILFYPDGTTSEAKVILGNQQGELYVVVSLRSLTGIAKVSDLVSADDVRLVP